MSKIELLVVVVVIGLPFILYYMHTETYKEEVQSKPVKGNLLDVYHDVCVKELSDKIINMDDTDKLYMSNDAELRYLARSYLRDVLFDFDICDGDLDCQYFLLNSEDVIDDIIDIINDYYTEDNRTEETMVSVIHRVDKALIMFEDIIHDLLREEDELDRECKKESVSFDNAFNKFLKDVGRENNKWG